MNVQIHVTEVKQKEMKRANYSVRLKQPPAEYLSKDRKGIRLNIFMR